MSGRRPPAWKGGGGWAAVSLLALACGGAIEPATPEERPAEIAAFARDLISAVCEREVRCERLYDAAGCSESAVLLPGLPLASPAFANHAAFFAGVDVHADLELHYRLASPADLERCLEGIEESGCWPADSFQEACQQLLTPKLLLPEGASCMPPAPYLAERVCADGLVCAGCGTCSRPNALGESCGDGPPCAEGLACPLSDAGGSTCQPRPLPGEACTGDCAEGVCSSQGVCETQPALGDPCDSSVPCQAGLGCEDGVCVAPHGLGEPCGSGCQSGLICEEERCVLTEAGLAGDPCTRTSDDCLTFCVFDTPDAELGTCGPAPLDLDGPCTFVDGEPYCPSGSYKTDPFARADCSCAAQKPLGAPCSYDLQEAGSWECSDAFCHHEGTCRAFLDDGEACTRDYECASSRCDSDLAICVELACSGCSCPI